MSSPQITVLALSNGDTQWNAPLYDLDAVIQIIQTRLLLFQGEWWANLLDGLPLWQDILAHGASPAAQQQMEAAISARILDSPFVIGLENVSIKFANRVFSYSASANTSFGTVQVTNFPLPPAVTGA